MSRKMIGFLMLVATMIYSRCTTAHFGNHWLPQTDAEFITDGLVLLMTMVSVAVMTSRENKP